MMALMCLMQNIYIRLFHKFHQIACLLSRPINSFSKWLFTMQQENVTTFGAKEWNFAHFVISLSESLWLYYGEFMHNSI